MPSAQPREGTAELAAAARRRASALDLHRLSPQWLDFGGCGWNFGVKVVETRKLVLALVLRVCYYRKREAGRLRTPCGKELCPLLFGIEYFSAVGALITASLIAEFLWLYFASKREKETT